MNWPKKPRPKKLTYRRTTTDRVKKEIIFFEVTEDPAHRGAPWWIMSLIVSGFSGISFFYILTLLPEEHFNTDYL